MLSPLENLLASNELHIAMTIICSVFCFIPMIAKVPSHFEESNLRHSMTSHYFQYPSVAIIALIAPLAVDIVLDMSVSWCTRTNKAIKLKQSMIAEETLRYSVSLPEKIIFLFSIVVVPIVALLPEDYPNLGLAFCCCHKFQLSIIGNLLMLSLCRMNKKYWGVASTVFLLLAIPLSSSMLVYADSMIAAMDNPEDSPYRGLQQAGMYLLYVNIAVFLWGTGRWLKNEVWPKVWTFSEVGRFAVSERDRLAQSRVYYSGAYVLSIGACICFLASLSFTANSLASWTERHLLIWNIGFLCPEITLVILSMRTAKYEVLQGLVSAEQYSTVQYSVTF
jgi:hypothetical protein